MNHNFGISGQFIMEIKEIGKNGILYSNALGEEQFLSFEECNNNWIAYRKRKENLNET